MGSNYSQSQRPITSAPRYHPTRETILQTRRLLCTFFPPELVDIILEEAEYWVRLVCDNGVDISDGDGVCEEIRRRWRTPVRCDNSQDWCVLCTPPLGVDGVSSDSDEDDDAEDHVDEGGEDLNVHMKVRKVVFELESHDQGWGGEQQDRGTYNGSWTWFEAGIIRPTFPSAASPSPSASTILTTLAPGNLLGSQSTPLLPTDPFLTSSIPNLDIHLVAPRPPPKDGIEGQPGREVGGEDTKKESKRWYIQCNVTASNERKTHVVVWKAPHEAELDLDFGSDRRLDQWKGRMGYGSQFVSLLHRGDRLAVFARALFPGWRNVVYRVRVEVFYSV